MGHLHFRIWKPKHVRRVETTFQQKEYVKRVDEWIKQSRLWMYERQISYQLIRLSDAFENSLRDFLKVRKLLIR